MSPQKPNGFDIAGKPPSQIPEPLKSKLEQEQRLAQLRQQKEAERQEKERARWRAASGPPRPMFGVDQKQSSETPSKSQPPQEEGGLFAKLKRGKFLK